MVPNYTHTEISVCSKLTASKRQLVHQHSSIACNIGKAYCQGGEQWLRHQMMQLDVRQK